MGTYTASPKKTAAGHGSQRWSEVRRTVVHRRYLCLWVLLALVPCYMLRQMFSSSSPRLSASTRPVENIIVGKTATEKPVEENYEVPEERVENPVKQVPTDEKTISSPRSVNVFREEVEKRKQEQKQEDEKLEKKVEKVEKKVTKRHGKKTKKTSTSKSISDHSLEKFDGDFGTPEDNEKDEEQNWQAPPAPIKKPTNLEESRR